MSVFSDFFKSAGFYFIGNVLSKLIVFFLLPIYTSYIATEDMGYYDVSNTYLNLIVTFLFLDIYAGIIRFIFDEKDPSTYSRPIFNGFLIFCSSLLIFSLITTVLWIAFDIPYIGYIYLFGVVTVCNNLIGYISRALNHNRLFAISGVIATIVMSLLNIFGLTYLKGGIEVLYLSSIAGLFVQSFILGNKLSIHKNISFRFYDKKLLSSLFKYSLPLSINSLAYWLLTGYTTAIISIMLGLKANGIYMIAVKFGMIVNLLSTCLTFAWQEISFKKGNDDKASLGLFYSKVINSIIFFLILGAIGLIHFSKIIFPFMIKGEYIQAINIIPIYVIGAILSVISAFMGQIYAALKLTKSIMYSTIIACIINIIITPIFINLWGLYGATIGMVVSYLTNVVLRIYVIRYTIDLKIKLKKIFILLLLLITSFIIFYCGDVYIDIIMLIVISIVAIFVFHDYIKRITIIIFNNNRR